MCSLQATKLYIPVSPLLVESLQWAKLHKAAKPGGRKLASSVPQLRASKQDLESSSFQQSFVEEVGSARFYFHLSQSTILFRISLADRPATNT